MNEEIKKIGNEHIKSVEHSPASPESLVEIVNMEGLIEYSKTVQGKVTEKAASAKRETLAELNSIIHSSDLSESSVTVFRREFDVDGKLKEPFSRMDRLVATTRKQIADIA